jgi:hypothetical protein
VIDVLFKRVSAPTGVRLVSAVFSGASRRENRLGKRPLAGEGSRRPLYPSLRDTLPASKVAEVIELRKIRGLGTP